MRSNLRMDMMFTLSAPLHHGAGTDGNVSVFRHQRVVVGDEVRELPVLSGNSLKHVVFRAPGVTHMLRTLGVKDGDLTRPVVHLLFSGGALTLKGSTVDIQAYRQLCETVPILGLLGGALGNTMMASRLTVGHGMPICDEYEPLLEMERLQSAGLVNSNALQPVAALLDTQMGTRHDPTRDPSVRRLIAGEEVLALEARKSADLIARKKGEHVKDEDSQQMIYERQVLAAGTQLWSEVYVTEATALEEAAVWAALQEWMRRPFLGANSAVGNGRAKLRITAARPVELEEPQWEPTSMVAEDTHPQAARANAMIAEYESHLREHREVIVETLREVVA